jgi:hypothetical protein
MPCMIALLACGNDAKPSSCYPFGRYLAGKDVPFLPCCAGWNEIDALTPTTDKTGAVVACGYFPQTPQYALARLEELLSG